MTCPDIYFHGFAEGTTVTLRAWLHIWVVGHDAADDGRELR